MGGDIFTLALVLFPMLGFFPSLPSTFHCPEFSEAHSVRASQPQHKLLVENTYIIVRGAGAPEIVKYES